MYWEFYQQSRIAAANRKAASAKSEAKRQSMYIERLEGKIESLALACQSLWELLRDQTGLTEDELMTKMEEVDLRDGKMDGKLTKATDACPDCGRRTSRRRTTCLYCGASVSDGEIFGRHS